MDPSNPIHVLASSEGKSTTNPEYVHICSADERIEYKENRDYDGSILTLQFNVVTNSRERDLYCTFYAFPKPDNKYVIFLFTNELVELGWQRWRNCVNSKGVKIGDIAEYKIEFCNRTFSELELVLRRVLLDKYVSIKKPLSERLALAESILTVQFLFNLDDVKRFFEYRGMTFKIDAENVRFYDASGKEVEGLNKKVIERVRNSLYFDILVGMFTDAECEEFNKKFKTDFKQVPERVDTHSFYMEDIRNMLMIYMYPPRSGRCIVSDVSYRREDGMGNDYVLLGRDWACPDERVFQLFSKVIIDGKEVETSKFIENFKDKKGKTLLESYPESRIIWK